MFERKNRSPVIVLYISCTCLYVIVSVRDDTELTSARDLSPAPLEEDRARDYWFSEHHRFEYSEYSEVLLELDPLSYHNVGLAVPGSFIEKRMSNYIRIMSKQRRKILFLLSNWFQFYLVFIKEY